MRRAISPGRVSRSTARLVWGGYVLLALVGLTGAVARTHGTLAEVIFSDGPVPEMTRLDRAGTYFLSLFIGVEPGSREWIELQEQNRRFFTKFTTHPLITLLHVMPAALFMVLAPLQLSERLRRRNIALHRWFGRLLVLLAIPVGLSGLWFGLLVPFAGAVEALAILIFGTWFFYALGRGFLAVRRRDVAGHREWMLRMLAIALGVGAVRIVGILLALLTREGPAAWFGASVWIGFASAATVAELWIRRSRRAPQKPRPTVALVDPRVPSLGG